MAFDKGRALADQPQRNRRGGFNSMTREKQREIQSAGGKAAHQKGTAHEFTTDEAQAAGRKGGLASAEKRRQIKAAVQVVEPAA